MKPLLIILMLVLFAPQVWAATYYVSTSGSDSANGTSASTPWAHHPWASNASGSSAAKVLAGDDVVYMRRGDTWYDCYLNANDAGSAGHQITTTSTDTFYANAPSDPLPKLSGAYNPASLAWTNTSGAIYSTPATTEPKIVVYNDTVLTKDTTSSPALNKWYWGSNILYVNVGEIPSNGTLEAGKQNYVNITGAGYQTYANMEIRVANTTVGGVAFNNGFNSVGYDRLIVKHGLLYGIYQYSSTGSYVSNSTISRVPTGVYSTSSSGMTLTGNNISYCSLQGLYVNAGGGGTISTNEISYSGTDSLGAGIRLGNSNSNTISQNYLHDNGTGVYPSSSSKGAIYLTGTSLDNIITKNIIANNYIGISLVAGGNNVVRNNTVSNSTVNGIDIQSTPNTAGVYEHIYNNTVIHDPSAANTPAYTGHGIDIQSTGYRAKIANNIVYILRTGENCEGLAIAGAYVDVQIDNNLIYDATSGKNANYGKLGATIYTSLAAWQAAVQADASVTGLDGVSANAESHSVATDPLLSGSYILISSPAIGAGSNTPITGIPSLTDPDARPITDSSGNVYSRWVSGVEKTAVDIGAYQYPSDALEITATGARGGYFNDSSPYVWFLPNGGGTIAPTGDQSRDAVISVDFTKQRLRIRLNDGIGQLIDKVFPVGVTGGGKSTVGI